MREFQGVAAAETRNHAAFIFIISVHAEVAEGIVLIDVVSFETCAADGDCARPHILFVPVGKDAGLHTDSKLEVAVVIAID